MRKLDISRQGSTIAMLKEQTTRLVNSLFRVTIEGENSRARKNILIADSSFEFWETHNGGWETHLNLNKKFLEDLLAHPVPIDLNVLHAIRKSPMAMDVYTWIAYRTYGIYTSGGRPVKIPWESLQAQFAANFGGNLDKDILTADEIIRKEAQAKYNFKSKFLGSLDNLAKFYPDLNQIISSDSQFVTIGGAKLIPNK
nr:replication protein RepA [Oligella urethralis]